MMTLLEGLIPVDRFNVEATSLPSAPQSPLPAPVLDDADFVAPDAFHEKDDRRVTVAITATLLFIFRFEHLDFLSHVSRAGEQLSAESAAHLQRLYVFALAWSVGALLERDDRQRLDGYLRDKLAHLPLPGASPTDAHADATVFDFVVDASGTAERVVSFFSGDASSKEDAVWLPL